MVDSATYILHCISFITQYIQGVPSYESHSNIWQPMRTSINLIMDPDRNCTLAISNMILPVTLNVSVKDIEIAPF